MVCDDFSSLSNVVILICELELLKNLGLTLQIGLNQCIQTCRAIKSKFVPVYEFCFLVCFGFITY